MELYPAVDLYEGKVVRLEKGDFQKCKVYSNDPVEMARRWVGEGAQWLHVVDLEGARSGKIKNWEVLEKILSSVTVRIQFGGGVRTEKDMERLMNLGIKRAVLGTKVLDPVFLKKISGSYANRIALSLDLRGEEVQIEGWLKGGGKTVTELMKDLRRYPIGCLIVTDIEKDGTLTGINLPWMRRLLEISPFPLICSGGITSLEDIRWLASLRDKEEGRRLEGIIIGKALYEGRIDLKKALDIIQ